jgi:phosphate transport system protein
MENHLLKRFDEELNKLRYRWVKMGTLVQQQIELAIKALVENNPDHAKLALELEDKINRLDIKIDRQCLRIFALHQPVAMDLRLVLSTVSMNDNMELIGDLAVIIAKNVIEMNYPPGLLSKTKLIPMCQLLESIIAKLMDSFINMNIGLALEVVKHDSETERLYHENFHILTRLMKSDNTLIESGSYLLDIDRNLQVISRQARAIAEELVFLFEAKMIKHKNIEDLEVEEVETHFEDED